MKRNLSLLLLFLLTACAPNPESPSVLIHAILYDGFELANMDEMVVLINISDEAVDIGGWQITDGESGTAVLPPRTTIQPSQPIWLAKSGTAVSNRFQHVSDFELVDSHPLIAQLLGTWPTLSDGGDQLLLLDAEQRIVDGVVYKKEMVDEVWWEGTAVFPIFVEEEGVFLQRVTPEDTNSAVDWEQIAVIESDGRQIASPRLLNTPLTPIER